LEQLSSKKKINNKKRLLFLKKEPFKKTFKTIIRFCLKTIEREQFVYPVLTVFFTALITWIFSKRKQNSELKSLDIDNEIKSADFYRNLLDDAMKRLNQAIDTINERDIKIKQLMDDIEVLTDELRKFKQLNGKT
jgi:hypothetical protein